MADRAAQLAGVAPGERAIDEDAVWWMPGRQFGEPCVGYTRVPISALVELYLAGESVEAVAEMYHVTRAAVLMGLAFEVVFRSRRKHSRAWRGWYSENYGCMWKGEWDKVPAPPREEAS